MRWRLPHFFGRAAVLLTSLVAATGSLFVPAPAARAAATQGAAFSRLAGPDLYATAATIATSTFATATSAVVATAAAPFDAAAGEFLSGALRAPVLFTDPRSLPAPTAAALVALHVRSVLLVGGVLAVGDPVQRALEAAGYEVTRLAGADSDETARAVATYLGPAAVGTTGSADPTAIITSGGSAGDLQAAAPLAYAGPFPVLFSDESGLPGASVDALKALGIRHALVLGGPLAVPSSVEWTLASLGITSERLAGRTNVDTAAEIANYELVQLGFTDSRVVVARGDDYADGLAGGAHAGVNPAPLLLTAGPTTVGGATIAWLAANCSALTGGTVLGGPLAISDAVVQRLHTAATCPTATPGEPTGSGTSGGTSGGGAHTGGGTAPITGTPASLVLSPASTHATSGPSSSVTVTATATRDGRPVEGTPVDFFVVDETTATERPTGPACTPSDAATPDATGTTPCAIDASDPTTDSKGQATFSFAWKSPAGNRPIEGSWAQLVYAFAGKVGTSFDASSPTQVWSLAHVVWTNAVSALALDPSDLVAHYGTAAELRVALMSTSREGAPVGVPEPGQAVEWRVYRAQACPASTTAPSGTPSLSGTVSTGPQGTAVIDYTYAPDPVPTTPTTDCLVASYQATAGGTPHEVTASAHVQWSSAPGVPSALELRHSGGAALVGGTQTLAAKVTDQYGAGVPGVEVSWQITRGGVRVASGTGATDATGQLAIADPSPSGPAADVVIVSAGSLPTTSASAYWVEDAPSGSYTSATVIGYDATALTAGDIDVSVGGTYLRLHYDGADVLEIGGVRVKAERFVESLTTGATITVGPYEPTAAFVSTFSIESTGHGGGALPGMCNGRSDANLEMSAATPTTSATQLHFALQLQDDANGAPAGSLVFEDLTPSARLRLEVTSWCRAWQHLPGQQPKGECDEAYPTGATTAHAVGFAQLDGATVVVRIDIRELADGTMYFRLRYRTWTGVASETEASGCEGWTWVPPGEGWHPLSQMTVAPGV